MTVWLETAPPLPAEGAPKLRGFYGRLYSDEWVGHHHIKGDKLDYSYPKVQYKVIGGRGVILGLDEGAEYVERVSKDSESVIIDDRRHKVESVRLEKSHEWLGVAPAPLHYFFVTPWLALNSENFQTYKQLGSWKERKEFLGRILVGNLLSLCKSFHLVVSGRVRSRTHLEETTARFKGISFKSFLGKVEMNFLLPPLAGIGRGVSFGFGSLLQRRRTVGGISLHHQCNRSCAMPGEVVDGC